MHAYMNCLYLAFKKKETAHFFLSLSLSLIFSITIINKNLRIVENWCEWKWFSYRYFIRDSLSNWAWEQLFSHRMIVSFLLIPLSYGIQVRTQARFKLCINCTVGTSFPAHERTYRHMFPQFWYNFVNEFTKKKKLEREREREKRVQIRSKDACKHHGVVLGVVR